MMENPLDLFFAVFTAAIATMIFFGAIDKLPQPVITVIVVLMFISSFFDVIA
jgi:hypothetical protein